MDAILDYRGKTPRKADSGIPLITARIVKNGAIDEPAEFIAEADYDSWMTRGLPEVGDVVLTMEAPLGEVAQLRTDRVALAQRIVTLRGKKGLIDNTFLKFLLQSATVQDQLRARSSGSTVTGIKQSELRKVLLPVPPLKQQKAIAHVLGAFDDKVDLCRKEIDTVEAMVQGLFRSWFVDLNVANEETEYRNSPKLAVTPADWQTVAVSKVAESVKGRSYRSEELQTSDTALITLKSFARGGGYRVDGLKSYVGAYKSEQIVTSGELVIACTDVTQAAEVVGRPAIVLPTARFRTLVASLDVLIVRPKQNVVSPPFLYCLFKEPRFTNHTYAHTSGTTVLHLATGAVGSYQFALPPRKLMESFTRVAAPCFEKLAAMSSEIDTLTALRDNLSPPLMSGQTQIGKLSALLKALA
ncbi:MAG: restriction endonuclease subunit S [Vulcanimicrobiaceae bacterium]